MNTELLKKYFTNKCTSDEIEEVILWFKNNAGGINERHILKKLWDEMEEIDTPAINFEGLLDKIHHRINLESAKNQSSVSQTQTKSSKRYLSIITKVAAMLFIPLLIGSIYFYQKAVHDLEQGQIYSEITSPNGSRTSFELPDGSEVWLNNGSSLRFPVRFTGDYRMLELSGEAYFKIVHNQDMPLIVQTDNLQVMVHGTEFNVMAYPDDENIAVTLESGSISLLKLNKNKDQAQNLLRLKPNQYAIFNKKNKDIKYMDIKPDKFTSWKDGKLIFVDDPIDLIMKKLERWYNVEIELKDKELSKYTYTATFTDEPINQVLELLRFATPIQYKIIKSKKLSDGSYSKKKIIISLKK